MLEDHYYGTLVDISSGLGKLESADSYRRDASRYQSVFEGATGVKKTNLTGVKRTWSLSWDHATEDQRLWFEGIHLGYRGTQPIRFFEAYTKNLMDLRSSTCGASPGVRKVFSTLGPGLGQSVTPPSVGTLIPTRLSTTLTSTSGSAQEASIGWAGSLLPKLGTSTFSVYLRAPNGGSVKLYFASDDSEAYFAGEIVSQTISASSGWQRVAVTINPPTPAKGIYPAISVPANSVIEVAQMQFELGSAVTNWVPGTGAQVIPASLGDEIPFFPYSGLSLDLLEA